MSQLPIMTTRSPADAKRKQERDQLKKDRFQSMIEQQMSTQTGRDFVRHVLKLLKYNEKNPENSANAYRVAAVQGAAIDLYNAIYPLCPEEWSLMMREGVRDGP